MYGYSTVKKLSPERYKQRLKVLEKTEPASIQLFKVMLIVYRPLREEEVSSATVLNLEDTTIKLLMNHVRMET
jgi:hypothetical protein